MENKIKQMLVKEESKYKFKCFFEKSYKIKAATAILTLSILISNNMCLVPIL